MSEVFIKNSPRLSEHEVDKTRNERRLELVGLVQKFVVDHPLFKDRVVNITFSHTGVSSLVSIIEFAEKKVVLKIPLSLDFALGEGQFLTAWEKAGVSVPHVIETGKIGEYSYTLMSYVDAESLSSKYSREELLEKGLISEMGRTLRLMHSTVADGYGKVVDGKAKYDSFKDWIGGTGMKKRFQYVIDENIFGDEFSVEIDRAVETLIKHVDSEKNSTYCHDDFGTSNIFATTPLTVFDPTPRFNNGYIDLGKAIVINISKGENMDEIASQLVLGYFGQEDYKRDVLHAAMVVAACFKAKYWSETKKTEQIKNVRDFILKNR